MTTATQEEIRLEEARNHKAKWRKWGPYLSERQWGTVREDYSANGTAWDYFTHDQARSRAYRWGEDGIAGISDEHQHLCFAIALWNGKDPILKERLFGITGSEGNHGEDVKEYYFYLDNTPTHSYMKMLYKYSQKAFPYSQLVAENRQRSRQEQELELLDTGVFDENRYFDVIVEYAKNTAEDILIQIQITNRGPEIQTLHLLPTLWFRNTWSWDGDLNKKPGLQEIHLDDSLNIIEVSHPSLGKRWMYFENKTEFLFTENETNFEKIFGYPNTSAYVKNGIDEYIVHGQKEAVNPDKRGTKAAAQYFLSIEPGKTQTFRLRLSDLQNLAEPFNQDFDTIFSKRKHEADEFYQRITPFPLSEDMLLVQRQAFAGMLWSKQFYYYDVEKWLKGDSATPLPAQERKYGRNREWFHLNNEDILSMPDKWEYPWFAAWDLAFHCVALAHVDPAFAKYQLILLCREWFQHPNGALPAYEWDFSDVNPPVQAWAALEVFAIDGGRDLEFLSRVFDKLLVNFTWWVNLADREGNNVFEGGFLGLDNIGPLDRSHLPVGGILEQSDATGWMGAYAIALAAMASVLNRFGQRPASDLVLKFLEHFASIRDALTGQGLWDEANGLYYDRLVTPSGDVVPVKVRSMVSIIPALAAVVIEENDLRRALALGKEFADFLSREGLSDPDQLRDIGLLRGRPGDRRLLLSLAGPGHLERLLARLFDEAEFLSPHGLRALSAYHREHPYQITVEGVTASIDYEPAESTTAMFGGNSNWRGPIWFPLNYLVISALERYHRFFGDQFTIEYPAGSGRQLTLDKVAADLQDRLISIFTRGPGGRRPCFGGTERMQNDPAWHDNLIFSEYFHGDNGAAIGAFHQTGWTGL